MGKALNVLKGVPGGAAGTVLKEAGKGVLKEGATEGAQNVIEQWGAFKDPTTGKIVALIEVDDWSHSAARNRIRDAMTAGAGYRTFRIPASARPTIPAVLRIVGPLREETVQIAFEG